MDFENVVPRRHTGSVKWDLKEFQGTLPMWVADMDFSCPQEVLDGIKRRVDHGIFGYSLESEELNELVIKRCLERYHWEIEKDWIVWLPGLETALTLVSMSVGDKNSSTCCLGPIYPPFYTHPKKAERRSIRIPLLKQGMQWQIDWEQLEIAFREGAVSLLLFCHPHNPVGKVFSKEELKKVAELCLKYDVVICSDEVHCDLILDNRTHVPFATVDPNIQKQLITLMAPSKTFNIAGLGCGFAIVPDPKLRQSLKLSMRSITPGVSPLSFAACESAYKFGENWRLKLLQKLNENLDLIEDFVKQYSGLEMIRPEATYLAWIDCSNYKLKDPWAHFKSYRLGLSPGSHFGDPQAVRLNFGCPKETLDEGLRRMSQALKAI